MHSETQTGSDLISSCSIQIHLTSDVGNMLSKADSFNLTYFFFQTSKKIKKIGLKLLIKVTVHYYL